MQKLTYQQCNFFIFVCFFSMTSSLFTMNSNYQIRESDPLITPQSTETWANPCVCMPYGTAFQRNSCTQDFKDKNGHICCRTHKPSILLGATCCILSNTVSPCNPSNNTLVVMSTSLFDQMFEFKNRRNTETVTVIEINMRVKPKTYNSTTETK